MSFKSNSIQNGPETDARNNMWSWKKARVAKMRLGVGSGYMVGGEVGQLGRSQKV